MRALIIQSTTEIGLVWKQHIEETGAQVVLNSCGEQALATLAAEKFDVIVLDLVLDDASAFVVADYANFSQPDARVVFVTDTSFFSDGTIFNHSANASTLVSKETPPKDLAAIVAYYGNQVITAKSTGT